jgi:hypothetical protein
VREYFVLVGTFRRPIWCPIPGNIFSIIRCFEAAVCFSVESWRELIRTSGPEEMYIEGGFVLECKYVYYKTIVFNLGMSTHMRAVSVFA